MNKKYVILSRSISRNMLFYRKLNQQMCFLIRNRSTSMLFNQKVMLFDQTVYQKTMLFHEK